MKYQIQIYPYIKIMKTENNVMCKFLNTCNVLYIITIIMMVISPFSTSTLVDKPC